jgi:chromosome segregation ATPase
MSAAEPVRSVFSFPFGSRLLIMLLPLPFLAEKEACMSDLSMKPARDELVSRRPAGRKAGGPAPQGMGTGLKLLIFLAALGVLGGGWLVWQKVQTLDAALDASAEALKSSQDELGSLQNKVQSQDKSLSKTGDQIGTAVAKLDLEVRKLWDLSNKRNRPDIEKLQKDVAAMTRQLEAAVKSNADLTAKLGQLQADNKALTASLDKLRADGSEIGKVQSALAGLKADQRELAANQLSLTAGQEKLQSAVTALKTVPKAGAADADIGKRVAQVESDIRAINTHRQQINARISQLDQDVQVLYQKR